MSPDPYRVVFDASRPSVEWRQLALESSGLVAVLAVLLLARRRALLSRRSLAAGAVVIGSALALWWAGAVWSERNRLAAASALAGGAISIVEGPVADFVPGEFHRRPESFRVASSRFEYWAYSPRWAFSRTVQLGGSMRNGLQVHNHHLGPDILKLEIAEPGAGAP